MLLYGPEQSQSTIPSFLLYLLSGESVQPYFNVLHEEKKSLFQGNRF